tara:strand:- start:7883 stop:8989 length:1107 start_codon:yes stop_codon:yes gene_type:complete
MKIVHIALGKVNTTKMNGVNRVIHNLAENQIKLGHEVTIWGITKNPIHNYTARNYKTKLFLNYSSLLFPKGMNKKIKTTSPGTVFHFHGGFIIQFYFIAKRIKHYGFSYVFTPHGCYNTVAMKRGFWKKFLFSYFFDRSIVKNAKSIHFVGESEIDSAKKIFDFDSFKMIPNGQTLKKSELSVKKNDIIVFGFCGRIDIKTKGLDILLNGFSNYLKEIGTKKAELWIIGDGREKNTLKSLAKKLGITNQVRFWGSVFGSSKIELMQKFDFIVLNSRNEGFPGVILEAAALGIPSIISKETNMAFYIKKYNTGYVLKENDSKHIKETLKTATEFIINKNTHPFHLNSRKMVAKEFDWELITLRVTKMYV